MFVACMFGCESSNEMNYACTAELRAPMGVSVSSPQGLPIDSVTAECNSEMACVHKSRYDSDDSVFYSCFEDGGGTYTVTVRSGDLAWTQKVDIKANECHTTEGKSLDFVLDPNTAD